MQKFITTLSLSLLLSLMFNYLVRGFEPGLGIFLFTASIIVVSLLLVKLYIPSKKVSVNISVSLAILVILLPPLIRDNVFATVIYCMLLPFMIIALLDEFGYSKPISITAGVAQAVIRCISLPISMISAYDQFDTGSKRKITKSKGDRKIPFRSLTYVAIGIILAIPLLVIFGGLFSSADPAFAQVFSVSDLIKWLADIDLWVSIDDLMVIVIVSLLLVGLYGIMMSKTDAFQNSLIKLKPPIITGYEPIIFTTFFSLLSILFGVFVFVQLRYLFGGSEQVISEATGLTFAQYARRGFVELLITSFLVIGISTVMLGVVDRVKLKKSLTLPFYTLIGLTFLIGVSAHYRLLITEQFYGLTNIRLLGHIMMLGVMAMLTLLFLSVRTEQFFRRINKWSLYISLSIILPLIVFPTDRLVAYVNWERFGSGASFDLAYNINLSDEATSLNLRKVDEVGTETMQKVTKAHYSTDPSLNGDNSAWNIYWPSLRSSKSSLDPVELKLEAENDLADFISRYSGALKNKNSQMIKKYWSDGVVYEDKQFQALSQIIVTGYVPVEIPAFDDWYLLNYDPFGIPNNWYGLYIPIKFNYKAPNKTTGEMVDQCMNDSLYVRLERGEWKITSAEVVWFGELEIEGETWIPSTSNIPSHSNPNYNECSSY